MNRKSLFCIVIVFFLTQLIARSQDNTQIANQEDSINIYFSEIANSAIDNYKILESQKIERIFKVILSDPSSYSYSFDSLKLVGKLYAPDKSFRLFTWNIPLEDGTYRYYGFIQAYNEKNKSVKLFELTDRYNEIKFTENSVLSAGKWYGALYYKILRNKVQNHVYYTLLGLRYNDIFVSQKIIEVLYFDEYDNPVFGAPLFSVDNKTKLRIVFQFSARVMMNLKYDEKAKMIVFDHLEPSESRYKGDYQYYGPDLTYDGFEFKKNMWQFRSNLDIRREDTSAR